MEDNHGAFESNSNEVATGNDHGWQKVTYAKRQRKAKPNSSDSASNRIVSNGAVPGADNVFRSLEQQSAIRRLQILEAQRSAVAVDADFDAPVRSKNEFDSSDEENERVVENGKAEEAKKVKPKKPKKPKVSVSDAAAKIDADDLSAFLVNISVSMSFSIFKVHTFIFKKLLLLFLMHVNV